MIKKREKVLPETAAQINLICRSGIDWHCSGQLMANFASDMEGQRNALREAIKLQPIATAPRDGTYVLLFGPSGYTTTPLRCEVCRYDAEYRPRQPWVNHSNDSFLDGGEAPTHWMPLPGIAGKGGGQ